MEPSTTEALAQSLATHRDSLIEHGVEQLITLWGKEFDGMSPGLVAEVVASRLSSSRWDHFKRPIGAAAKPSAQAERAIGVFGARAQEVLAAGDRLAGALKAHVAGSSSGAPGLAGDYR